MVTASSNPFSENPFQSKSSKTAPSSGAWGPAGGSQAGSVPAYTQESSPSKAPTFPTKGPEEAGFAKREADLNAREAELKRWEADLRSSGRLKPKKNWPRCCPVAVMDIQAEVPVALQSVVSVAYLSFLGLCVCLLYQLAAVIVALALINIKQGRLSGFFLALIYLVIGIPGAWFVWYIRLYTASIKDAAFTYAWFFLAYLIHIFWCIWSAVSPPILFNKWSYCGWITAIVAALPQHKVVGIVYIVGAIMWSAEALLSIWVLKDVYSNFRGNKGEERLKSAALQSVALHAVNRV